MRSKSETEKKKKIVLVTGVLRATRVLSTSRTKRFWADVDRAKRKTETRVPRRTWHVRVRGTGPTNGVCPRGVRQLLTVDGRRPRGREPVMEETTTKSFATPRVDGGAHVSWRRTKKKEKHTYDSRNFYAFTSCGAPRTARFIYITGYIIFRCAQSYDTRATSPRPPHVW